jgi:hypothetical protein
MVAYLDILYSSINGFSKLDSLKRFSLRLFSNFLVPIYFKLSFSKKKIRSLCFEKRVIVSLTTFPARIQRLWLVVECMLRQSYVPDFVVLYLSKEQFPNLFVDLPHSLNKYINSGFLKVCFVEDDLRSHKKYFYSFQEFSKDIIVLIDDDIFYGSNVIEELVLLHRDHPNDICCHRAKLVAKNESGSILPYNLWPLVNQLNSSNKSLFYTTGGGTLFIPALLPEAVFDKVFKDLCFYADDVWLNFHSQMAGIYVTKSDYSGGYIPIYNWNNISLLDFNINNNGNDFQLSNLFKFYKSVESNFF